MLHILFARPAIYTVLNILFCYMLRISLTPKGFGLSVVTSVIKNKNTSVNDVNNYRPVSIIPIIAKLF